MTLSATRILTLMLLSLLFVCANANERNVHSGARVYLERCEACHGATGMGDGQVRKDATRGLEFVHAELFSITTSLATLRIDEPE